MQTNLSPDFLEIKKYCIPMFMATDMNGKTAMCIRTIPCHVAQKQGCRDTQQMSMYLDIIQSETNLKDNCVIPTPTEMKYLRVTYSTKTGWCLKLRDK